MTTPMTTREMRSYFNLWAWVSVIGFSFFSCVLFQIQHLSSSSPLSLQSNEAIQDSLNLYPFLKVPKNPIIVTWDSIIGEAFVCFVFFCTKCLIWKFKSPLTASRRALLTPCNSEKWAQLAHTQKTKLATLWKTKPTPSSHFGSKHLWSCYT